MIPPKALPVHPFWKFSVKIYSYPVVEETLVALQNDRGLNINVVLFCCWYSLGDQGRLQKSELKNLLISIQPWHERIVVPLRRIRQQLKSQTTVQWTEIRQEILQHELTAEQIEQLIILENFNFIQRPVKTNFQRIVDICKNLFSYCQLVNVFLDSRDCEGIAKILSMVFVKIDPGTILRYCMDHLVGKELKTINQRAQLPLDL